MVGLLPSVIWLGIMQMFLWPPYMFLICGRSRGFFGIGQPLFIRLKIVLLDTIQVSRILWRLPSRIGLGSVAWAVEREICFYDRHIMDGGCVFICFAGVAEGFASSSRKMNCVRKSSLKESCDTFFASIWRKVWEFVQRFWRVVDNCVFLWTRRPFFRGPITHSWSRKSIELIAVLS